MSDDDLIDAMRMQRTQLEPSTEEMNRMRLVAQVTFGASEPVPLGASHASRRRARISMVAVAGVAFVVAAVVAFGPGSGNTNHAMSLPTPATASAAFEQAATAAGNAPWTPLGSGAYFHTLVSTFDPVIPARHADPASQIANLYRWNQNGTTEQWLDGNGRGRTIETTGSIGNPDLFPGLLRSRKTHLIVGYAGYVNRQGHQVNNPLRHPTVDQLKYPDSVTVTDRPKDATTSTQTMWMRQAAGYVTDGARRYARPDLPGKNPTEQAQIEAWGASLASLQQLDNLQGRQLHNAVLNLLIHPGANEDPYPLPGFYDVTKGSQASGLRVRRAIKLLGSAPLAPAARQELFRTLASEPNGKLRASAKDRIGRVGTRVTFETIFDRDMPARRVSGAAAWKLAGGVGPVPASVKPYFDLPAYHAFHRWYVDVIFDRTSGELLQYVFYSRWRSNGRLPRLTGPWHKPTGVKFYGGESQADMDSGLYGVRDRATDFAPAAPVCHVDTTPCSPSTKPLPGG